MQQAKSNSLWMWGILVLLVLFGVYRSLIPSIESATSSKVVANAPVTTATADKPTPPTDLVVAKQKPPAETRFMAHVGETVSVKKDWVACPVESDFDRLEELGRQADLEAFKAYYGRSSCVRRNEGSVGLVEEAQMIGQGRCVRFEKQPDCLWITITFLRPA